MRKSNREVNGEKVFRYSIRKYHFGAASVAVAALMFFANGAVKADTLPVSPATANTEKVNAGVTNLTEGVPLEKSLEAEGNKEIVAPEPAEETSNKEDGSGSNAQGANEIKVSDKDVIPANQTEEINKAETNGKEKEVVTNKDKLESLLKEIDQLNLKDYTEATVNVLQEKVAKAKEVLVNATTQKEIDSTYNALVGYKNAGLKRVPKPKGELTPKPDTTNGKATVGIKAENTTIFGHSMGSLIAMKWVIENNYKYFILSGFPLQKKLSVFLGKMLTGLEKLLFFKKKSFMNKEFKKYNDYFKPNQTKFDWLTRDENEVNKYVESEFCGYPISPGVFNGILGMMGFINRSYKKVRKDANMLVIYGTEDKAVNAEYVTKILEILKKKKRRINVLENKNGRHESLNEINKYEIYDEILKWLNEREK